MKDKTIQFHLLLIVAIALMMLFGASYRSYSIENAALEEWRVFAQTRDSKNMIEWLRCQARGHINNTRCSVQISPVTPGYFGMLGIFVTLKKGKMVRGCYGAFYHSSTDIRVLLTDYLIGALTRDPRHKPLELSELDSTEIIITITSLPNAVPDFESIDLHRQGVVAACDNGESIVFVPAELRDHSYLRSAIRGKSCQASTFNAVMLR